MRLWFQEPPPSVDSTVVESPLPGGVAYVVRFLANSVPTWLQIGGMVVGGIVALVLLSLIWRRRRDITGWITARNRAQKIALGASALVVVASAGAFGGAAWNYTQHDNDFCTGCHVMKPAYHRFIDPENKHASLSCHDCHQQSMYASARQAYLWVAERPEEIGPHARVPNAVCEKCHVTGDTARWQHVATTAGHRVHLESDSSALENVQCVTCHGVEVHQFKPVTETCGQSGCHDPGDTHIVLGRMALQSVRHCTSCHEFTADVPALATRDSAAGTLRPGHTQCLGCHEMQRVLADFDAGLDPHGGKCGSCHNPHVQETPAAAAQSCATSGCHADWRNEPFHVGTNHRAIGSQCLTCHLPHSARVDASDCESCHRAVRQRGVRQPPLPFDTSAALRRSGADTVPPSDAALHDGQLHRVTPDNEPPWHAAARGPSPNVDDAPADSDEDTTPEHASGVIAFVPHQAAADSFPHNRHTSLACLVCHQTQSGRGRLTFEAPRGCSICHHQAPTEARCASCHQPEELASPIARPVRVGVPGHAARERPVDFLHAQHRARPCLECHTEPVSLAPASAVATCSNCHAPHHAAGRECSACHQLARPVDAHPSLDAAHQRCDACHTGATIERLTPDRSFCGTCHAPQRGDHYAARECTTCHFLSTPAEYRARLRSGTS